MKKYALTLITFLSALAAQAHVEYEIPPHVAYHCGQQPGSTQENLLLPKITQVESGPEQTRFELTLANFTCVNGQAIPTQSAGLGSPWFNDLDFSYNEETPVAEMNRLNAMVYQVRVTVSNEVLAQSHQRRFQMIVPFGFSHYILNVIYNGARPSVL
jgi:hypothetical protein